MNIVNRSHSLRCSPRVVAAAAVAVAVAAILLIAVSLFRAGQNHTTAPEVDRSELVLQDGQLFRAGESDPFSGMLIERYPDNSVKSRSAVSSGLLHGISEGWHPNGILQIREHFRGGTSHGLRTKWYDTGVKMSEAEIREGKLHGTFRRWHENGTLAEQIELRDGDPDGTSLAFYQSGFVKAQVRLERGNIVAQKFWDDGERQINLPRETSDSR